MSLTMTETELSSPTSTSSSSSDLSPSSMEGKAYKKSNKPMMEKKRRARINSSLCQLKTLVLQAMKKDNSQYSKLEKADILELTVRHLKNVQRYQTSSMAQFPDALSKYRAGFNECANEVVRYLGESQGVNNEARTRIISHLASLLTPINALQIQHTPILPATIQQQQPRLQQLHLQQQQNQNVFLTSTSQPLSVDTNNKQQPIFLTTAGNSLDINHVGPPTAFQTPITSGTTNPHLSGIGNATMATSTPLQLVTSTLPTGQVALVLAPHSVSNINLLAAPQGAARAQIDQELINTKSFNAPRSEDCKSRPSIHSTPISFVVKPKEVYRENIEHSSEAYQKSGTLRNTQLSFEHPPAISLIPPSAHSSNIRLNNSEIFITSPVSDGNAKSSFGRSITTVTNPAIFHNNAVTTTTTAANSRSGNVVRATSTWRPW